MKTIADFKKANEVLMQEMSELQKVDGKDKKVYAAARRKLTANRKKIQFNNFLIKYLFTEPKEDFIKSEKSRLENRISEFMKNYTPLDPNRFTKSILTAHKKSYEKEMGIPKIKKQLNAMIYLL